MNYQDTVLNIRVSKETKIKLKEYATARKQHLSALMRILAEDFIRNCSNEYLDNKTYNKINKK